MNKTIENFVDFCDEMQIAEESIHSMKKEFTKEKKRIDEIHKEIRNCYDIKKQIQMYKELSNILKSLYTKVNKMDPSLFDKAVGYGATVLTVIAPIATIITTNVLLRKMEKVVDDKITGKNIGSLIAGAAVGVKVDNALSSKRDVHKTKKEILTSIICMERSVDNCIKVLSNPKYTNMIKNIKRDKDYHNKLSNVKYDYDWKNGQGKLCYKIITEIRDEVNKLTTKYGIPKFDQTIREDEYLYDFSIDFCEEYDYDKYDDPTDLQDDIEEMVDEITKKYESQLDKLGCSITFNSHEGGEYIEITVGVEE